MSIPILRRAGATVNLTKLVESFDDARASTEAAAFYVLDLPASPCVDMGTWLQSVFGPPALDPIIIAPDGVCDVASRALPGTAVYAYDPRDWSVRPWKPVDAGRNLRNVDKYGTAKEAFGAFEAMCLAQCCSECRFHAPWVDLGIKCRFLWLYGGVDKENAK